MLGYSLDEVDHASVSVGHLPVLGQRFQGFIPWHVISEVHGAACLVVTGNRFHPVRRIWVFFFVFCSCSGKALLFVRCLCCFSLSTTLLIWLWENVKHVPGCDEHFSTFFFFFFLAFDFEKLTWKNWTLFCPCQRELTSYYLCEPKLQNQHGQECKLTNLFPPLTQRTVFVMPPINKQIEVLLIFLKAPTLKHRKDPSCQ